MSVDLAAELPAPISLAAVVKGTREVLSVLLGLDSVAPELEAIDGWQVASHLRVSSRRPMPAEECADMLIGGRIPAREGENAGPLTFELGLVGSKDRAYLMVIDLTALTVEKPGVQAVVSPTRSCVGVVLATAVALSSASASGGEFVDEEIVMLDRVAWDPARFIELARLTDARGDFGARCEQFMRQFPSLNGWPSQRSADDGH